MKRIFGDFETFWSDDYTLKKMTPIEYILDARFECIGCSVAEDEFKPPQWLPREQIVDYLNSQTKPYMFISHNALFDASILSYRYGIHPTLLIDTLGMARALLMAFLPNGRASLEKTAAYLGVGRKSEFILQTKNKRADEIESDPEFYTRFVDYGRTDCDLCRAIYYKLVMDFPSAEHIIMDMVIKTTTQPALSLDLNKLYEHLYNVKQAKAELLEKVSTTPQVLASNVQFAELLRSYNIDPPTKISQVTKKLSYAFAKTDFEFMALAEHPDPDVQALVAARLGIKSTLEETRTEKFIRIGEATINSWTEPVIPMALRYSGAHTHRLSGDWGLNCLHPDMEVFTPNGWQRIEDWQPETPIMQWFPDGKLEWEIAAKKIERQENSYLIWFNAPFVNGGFTTNHRIPYWYKGRIRIKLAGEIEQSRLDNIPIHGRFENTLNRFTLNQTKILVALSADGSKLYENIGSSNDEPRQTEWKGGWQFGFIKQRKIDRLRKLLQDEQIIFNEWSDGHLTQFTIRGSNTPIWMQKGINEWVLSLSPECMDIFLDELPHWDGMYCQNQKQIIFYTTILSEAQWVQTIGFLRGRPATLKFYSSRYDVYFRESKTTSISKIQSLKKPYNGKVYCPQVTSSFIIVRYNGAIFITGNCQNLPSKKTKTLRDAIIVPPDHVILAVDASQIEARLTAWFAGQKDLLQRFEVGADVYSEFATDVFGYPCSKETPLERFAGKTCILGLGFGMGGPKLQWSLNYGAQEAGIDHYFGLPEAYNFVNFYRGRYDRIDAFWDRLNAYLPLLAMGGSDTDIGPCKVDHQSILLPNGLRLYYHDLRYDAEAGEWKFTYGGGRKKLWGGKFLENLVQAFDRIIIMDAALRVWQRTQIRFAHNIHDELLYVVHKSIITELKQIVIEEMERRPKWGLDIPLKAEAKIGTSYGDLK